MQNTQGFKNKITTLFGGLSSKQDLVALRNYNNAINNGTKATAAFKTHLANTSAETRLLAKNIARGTITFAEAEEQIKNTATSTKAASVAFKALGVAANVALNVGISLAISAIISGVYKLINAQKEAIEKAKNLSEEYKNNQQSLISLRDEYLNIINSTDTAAKKDEALAAKKDEALIEWKKKLAEQYGIEREEIRKVNLERQTGLDLLDEELRKNARKTVNDLEKENMAQEAMLKYYGLFDEDAASKGYYGGRYDDDIRRFSFTNIASGYTSKDAAEYVRNIVSDISNEIGKVNVKDLYEQLGVLRQVGFNIELDTDDAQESFDKLDELLTELKTRREGLVFQGKSEEVAIIDNIINSVEKSRDKVKSIIDETQTTVNSYLSSQAQLIFSDYIKAGNAISDVTEDNFETWKEGLIAVASGSEPLKNALSEMIDIYFPQFAEKAEDTDNTLNNDTTPSVEDLTTAYKSLSEALDEIYDKQDKLTDAFSKVVSGVKLTRDEILELVDTFPELVNYVTNSGDGYTISVEGLKFANDNLSAETREQSQNIIDAYIDAEKRLQNLKTTPIGGSYDAQKTASEIAEVQKYLSESKDTYASALLKLSLFDEGFDDHKMTLDGLNEKYDIAKSSVDDYNNSIKSIDSAIDKMNSKQALTYDEMVELVEISPELAECVDERTDGYYIEIEALKDLRTESKETRNNFIQNKIDEAEAAIASAETIVKANSIINSHYDYMEKNPILQQQFEIIRNAREDLKIYKQMLGDLYDDSSSGGGSGNDETINAFEKELKYLDYLRDMGMISAKEYYKQLFFLNEKYYSDNEKYLEQYRDNEIKIRDGVTDIEIRAIDRQIEALELLKEKREEEKELQELQVELEEKKLELLNKQSQKNVRYYDAEKREWIWTYNRNDVADAQKAVDEAQEALDEHLYQSNEDKKIEQLEQIKEILQGDEDNPNNSTQWSGSEGVTTQATARKVTAEEFYKYIGLSQKVDTTALMRFIYAMGLQPNVQKIAESTHNQNISTINRNVQGNQFTVNINGSNLTTSELEKVVENGFNEMMMDLVKQMNLKIR